MDTILHASLIGTAVGVGCGLVPFSSGMKNNRFVLGGSGLALCGAAGCALGLIGAIPTAALFTWWINRD